MRRQVVEKSPRPSCRRLLRGIAASVSCELMAGLSPLWAAAFTSPFATWQRMVDICEQRLRKLVDVLEEDRNTDVSTWHSMLRAQRGSRGVCTVTRMRFKDRLG